MKQIPLAIGFEADRGFEAFVPGANSAALQHLQALQLPAAPVYLWGGSGSGKTHLLQALAQTVQQQGLQMGWFDARTPLPWDWDDSWSLIVFDDCEALDADHQQAAFALFAIASPSGVQVAAAGAVPPTDLPLREDLRSRLGWGHVFALEPLSEAETRAALRREADRRGLFLSDEVMDYVLSHFTRDLKHLMSLLDRLDGFALTHKRAVTLPLLRQMLAEEEHA
jgi:DnaA family protein